MAAHWFVRGDGKVYGPIDAAKLKQLASGGKIGPQTEVAKAATGPWVAAGQVGGLFSVTEQPPPPPPSASQIAPAGASSRPPRQWYRRWWAVFVLYPFLAFMGCGVVIQLVVPKETLDQWKAEADERAKQRAQQKDKAAAASRAVSAARQRGEDAGHQAGFLWARLGKRLPDRDALHAAAAVEADEAIPSNTALIGSGSDEDRLAYARGWVSQFPVGYNKAN